MFLNFYKDLQDWIPCAHTFEWHKRFGERHENVEDDEHPGCLCTSRTKGNVGKKLVGLFKKTDDLFNVWTITELVNSDRGTGWDKSQRFLLEIFDRQTHKYT